MPNRNDINEFGETPPSLNLSYQLIKGGAVPPSINLAAQSGIRGMVPQLLPQIPLNQVAVSVQPSGDAQGTQTSSNASNNGQITHTSDVSKE